MNFEKLTFVSNFKSDDIGGGWNGINSYLFKALQKELIIDYIGPINPIVNFREKLFSKISRTFGFPGSYFFFSEKRLKEIASRIHYIDKDAILFFFGSTPWVKYNGPQSYVVYTDICFEDYLNIFLDKTKFHENDIKRIVQQEKDFLQNAVHVFWGSHWARDRSEKLYKTKFTNSTILSTGGVISLPDSPPNIPQKFNNGQILFISTDFLAKGGDKAFNVVEKLNNLGFNCTLCIVGDAPPAEICNSSFVKYYGYLKKTINNELSILQNLYRSSFLLIHPTKMDTMGAVIVEAGYFGLPCIAPNNFGIPDLILDSITGILVSKEINEDEIIERVIELKRNKEKYVNMSVDVQKYMFQNRTWESLAQKIKKVIIEI